MELKALILAILIVGMFSVSATNFITSFGAAYNYTYPDLSNFTANSTAIAESAQTNISSTQSALGPSAPLVQGYGALGMAISTGWAAITTMGNIGGMWTSFIYNTINLFPMGAGMGDITTILILIITVIILFAFLTAIFKVYL
jgi:hypothetical protein